MIYRGRSLDAVSLWSKWVDFPAGMDESGFAPLVRCPNPNHPTDKKHFQVNLDKPLVHCFANCGISGTYEKAIALIEDIPEREAYKLIIKSSAVSVGASSKRKRRGVHRRGPGRARVETEAEIVNFDFSRYIPEIGEEYLRGRGIDGSSIATWGIGWDTDERRIVLPARDERGHIRFLIKRAVREKDWPKYLYWPEKEQGGWGKTDLLYGACHLDPDVVRSSGIVLCEGSLDCVKLHQNEIRNTVAILGSYLSERQVEILAKFRPPKVYLLFDKDAAGYRATKSAYHLLAKYPLFVCLYPKGKSDPAELSRKEVEKSIASAISIVEFNNRLPKRLRLERKAVQKYAKVHT